MTEDTDTLIPGAEETAPQTDVDAEIAELNETYALVLVGDKPVVMETIGNKFKFLTISAFRMWLANRHVQLDDGRRPLAKYWIEHPQRRQFSGIEFVPGPGTPGHFNLWRGFAVTPRDGDCSKFLTHLKDNVCGGDEELYNWVVGWFAQIFQQPDKKTGTSLVLRGKQGTGKTKVGEVVGSLLGDHYSPIADPRYVTGQFNAHLVSCLLLHCDEAFWAGDHSAEGKLKDLVTGKDQFIEYKGKEPILVRNYVRLLVSGNQKWLVPSGFEERRFAVIDVGEAHMQDFVYFAAIDAEMDNGGREALLDFFLKLDLSKINLRSIPKTAALFDQKIASLSPDMAWWLDTLTRGSLPGSAHRPECCSTKKLFDAFIDHANQTGIRRRAIETQLGIFLKGHVPGLKKSPSDFGSIYEFPPLADCRAFFAEILQQDREWDEPDKWTICSM
jgi:hypothetical protein